MWKRAVDSLLGHQHEVGGVCLGDALADIPGVTQVKKRISMKTGIMH